jgi:hypothetical protein
MRIYEKVFSSKASHFGALVVLSSSLALIACDKDSYDDLPENTGNNNTLTGGAPEGGELLDQNIGLDGRWETYCEGKSKYIFIIKGSTIKKIGTGFKDDICTQPRDPANVETGFTSTYTLKPPITTPSGLTAYPIELRITSRVSSRDLFVLHENKLYWQEKSVLGGDDGSHPADIDIYVLDDGRNDYYEFHRVE